MTARFRRRGGSVVARFTVAEAGVLERVVQETVLLLGGEVSAGGGRGEPGGSDAAEADDAAAADPFGDLADLDRPPPEPPDDPALARLLPDGYRDDPQAAAELRRLTEASLRAAKIGQARRLLDDLPAGGGAVSLDEEAANAWLGALNDVRLALGTRLEITEDTDIEAVVRADPNGEDAYRFAIYDWLTFLQDTLVLALSGGR